MYALVLYNQIATTMQINAAHHSIVAGYRNRMLSETPLDQTQEEHGGYT